ncbi:hypothetical protein CKO31_18480 [Thiohalocapsa halophila]|uniref:Uncharacterized protein n=1 Tax=Thiohalocapsa halophila TaxID=69359 RepID=A0ABS1CMI0_9GAMM|nr:hypothetical protein [Thiohalocapsa halophila]MBK1632694.1 hypothetical protein [Thiohalocapsa halophila]
MNERPHWLYRPENRPKLWALLVLIMVLALSASLVIHPHAHFPGSGFALDASFGFYAWYGFVTCAAMVAVAKILGIFLKRPDTYYDD